MRALSAKEAKNRFGELLLEAQKSPVMIEKNGKPVAVVYSYEEHHHIEEAKLAWLRRRSPRASRTLRPAGARS